MHPEGGTVAVITSTPARDSASRMPLQYCIPGRDFPTRCISSNPRRPWARMIGCFGASYLPLKRAKSFWMTFPSSLSRGSGASWMGVVEKRQHDATRTCWNRQARVAAGNDRRRKLIKDLNFRADRTPSSHSCHYEVGCRRSGVDVFS